MKRTRLCLTAILLTTAMLTGCAQSAGGPDRGDSFVDGMLELFGLSDDNEAPTSTQDSAAVDVSYDEPANEEPAQEEETEKDTSSAEEAPVDISTVSVAHNDEEQGTFESEKENSGNETATETAQANTDSQTTTETSTAEDPVVQEEEPDEPEYTTASSAPSVITYNLGDKFPSFGTYTTDGNYVTDSIFSQADVTVINIWGTYCSPCINEMPELGEWSRNMPSNVQIYGIVCDAYDINDTYTISEANEIIDYTGADFPHMLYSYDMYDLFNEVYAVPTTIFVNREGYIVGDWYVGADVSGYKNMVSTLLNSVN